MLARDPPPEHIVIETSGLALPQPLVRAFAWPGVRHRVTVDGIVTVVDAVAVAAGRFAPDAASGLLPEHDNPIEELFEDQLRCADLVVVCKSDLVDADIADAVEAIVRREARAGTPQIRGTSAGLPVDVLLGLSAAAEADMAGRESHHELEGEEHDHDDFDSFVVAGARFPTLDALKAAVTRATAIPGVLRIKGRAAVDGRPTPALVQAVGPRVDAYFAPDGAASGLVVIGMRDMDREAVEKSLMVQ